MKNILISVLIACSLVAILNIFKPIENTINTVLLSIAISVFIYVYLTLWITNRKRRKK